FGRLFDLAETKSRSMAEMYSLGVGVEESSYRWQWQPDPDKGYSIRGAYQLLTSHKLITVDVAEGLIWHTQVSLKVFIFAWRLLPDKLPTKDVFGKSNKLAYSLLD
ncbi:cysteine-rich receptor-like protein kinase, partial [Trifolium pratense]